MATLCGGIAANINNDCNNLPTAGVLEVVTLFNFEDVLAPTYKADSVITISALKLKTGAKGYTFTAINGNVNKARFTTVKKDVTNIKMFQHGWDTIVTNKSAINKEQLMAMKDGLYVAVITNRGNRNDTKVEVLGLDSGLELSTLEWNSGENEGAYTLSLQTIEGQEEAYIPATIQINGQGGTYDPVATLAYVTTLQSPATPS